MEIIQRVFFHELGHFIAHELNHKHYNGTGVEEMALFPCKENTNEFCGHCKPINNSEENNPVLIERLPEYLAVLVHGCLFQAYFMKQNFTECLCCQGNGLKDLTGWTAILSSFKQNTSNFSSIEDEFFKRITTENALERFRKLNIWDYLTNTDNQRYLVNIEKLRDDISVGIVEYLPYYNELITQYKLKVRHPMT
ncbi:hypothetical protein [Flectobacillus major]|uniref:hypothetical protein n=1 Tax=Flectobacillus major TaxID=103 RepID=UPI00041393AE|nr:hypothetical protein [Flectobacillus major]